MRTIIAGLCAASVLLLSTPLAAADPAVSAKPSGCFFARNFESWKAPDAKTIYIRVSMHNYYRLDLAGSCPTLLWPASYLITKFHGSDTVCSALDWDLQVSQGMGSIPESCIVKTMTALTPDEAAAIPKKFKPQPERLQALDELVEELGVAFSCLVSRIVNGSSLDHAAYVASWLDILDRDTKAIFTAASKAQEAIEYLMHSAAEGTRP